MPHCAYGGGCPQQRALAQNMNGRCAHCPLLAPGSRLWPLGKPPHRPTTAHLALGIAGRAQLQQPTQHVCSSPGPVSARAAPAQGPGLLACRPPRPAACAASSSEATTHIARHRSSRIRPRASAPVGPTSRDRSGSPMPCDDAPTPLPSLSEVLDQHGWMLDAPLEHLMGMAAALRDSGRHGAVVTFSPKVFLPLTRLCRDTCGYCTFAQPPRPGRRAFMTLEEVLQVASLGSSAGCSEALLTLGDKPEQRWPEAAAELAEMGYGSTIDYVEAAARAVLRETGLLPHINAGVCSEDELRHLKQVSASQGLMLESTSPALMLPGAAHHGCPDKDPAVRLATIEAAGRAEVPFTSGILVGIGDTRPDRLHALACLHRLHARYGHIQELIIQNFRSKPATAMASWPEPPLEELLWAVAAARIMFGPHMNIQAPPNLTPLEAEGGDGNGSPSLAALQSGWRALLDAGINDWGGISPLTRDFVNPEKPWPHLSHLAAATASAGKLLLPRLPIYPTFLGLRGDSCSAHDSRDFDDSLNDSLARRGGSSDGNDGGGGGGSPAGPSSSSQSSSSSSRRPQPCWLDFTGGRDSVGAAVLRSADSQGFLRASSWVAGRPDVESDPEADSGAPDQQQPQRRQQGRDGEGHGDCYPQPRESLPRGTIADADGSGVRQGPGDGQVAGPPRASVPLPRWREGRAWRVAVGADGALEGVPQPTDPSPRVVRLLEGVLHGGRPLQRGEVELLLRSRGADHAAVCAAADELRRRTCGDTVSYVVNRNINYTNVCTYKCAFCAFSKGKAAEELRGPAYVVPYEEIARRTAEAWDRGATEVCMQGGIHPDFSGHTYLRILAAAKQAAPGIHVHAFSPLEVHHGATTLGMSYESYLERLAAAGLGSLPGTAAEVLHDDVRRLLCPDKINTSTWLKVVGAAHSVGLRTTSTLMFGSVEEGPAAWATHLVQLRELQQRAERSSRAAGGGSGSGVVGITEFVPLPFVHMEAPVYLQGNARRGPSLSEGILLHAVSRLALHPHIPHIQASWVKMGPSRAAQLLAAGADDMGGSIMNETITRAAGASHGQELPPSRMEEIIRAAGRQPRQRTTLYGTPPAEQTARSYGAAPLQPLVTAAPSSGALR